MQLGPRAGNAWDQDERRAHLDYVCDMIDWAVDQYTLHSPLGVKLIVGPEMGMYGWQSLSLREMHEKYAIEIPGPETDRLIEKAKEYGCYISPGSIAERDTACCEHLVFNTQILVGPEGVLYRYRKVQPWMPHENTVSPHDLLPTGYDTDEFPLFPVVETEIGRLGGWICYDSQFPEIARQLAYNGCEIFLGSTAYMDPYGRPPVDAWATCCRTRSIENMAYGIYTGSSVGIKQLASAPTSGNSLIVDFEGRVLAQTGHGETLTCATLDIDALRDHRKHSRLNNHLVNLRTEAYTYLQTPRWQQQVQLADAPDWNLDDADEVSCRQIERFWSEYYGEKVEVPRWRPSSWSETYQDTVGQAR